jgi:hypothetical protein
MSARLCFALAALLSSARVSLGASYNLVKDYSGQTFFDSWSYYGSYDNLTSGKHLNRSCLMSHIPAGDVIWVNQSVADGTPPLTYINSAGNAIVKVSGCFILALIASLAISFFRPTILIFPRQVF